MLLIKLPLELIIEVLALPKPGLQLLPFPFNFGNLLPEGTDYPVLSFECISDGFFMGS